MARQRSPNRDKAFEIYKEHSGNIDLIAIAEQLKLSAGTIRGWKNKDEWDYKLYGTLRKNMERSKRKKERNQITKMLLVDLLGIRKPKNMVCFRSTFRKKRWILSDH